MKNFKAFLTEQDDAQTVEKASVDMKDQNLVKQLRQVIVTAFGGTKEKRAFHKKRGWYPVDRIQNAIERLLKNKEIEVEHHGTIYRGKPEYIRAEKKFKHEISPAFDDGVILFDGIFTSTNPNKVIKFKDASLSDLRHVYEFDSSEFKRFADERPHEDERDEYEEVEDPKQDDYHKERDD